jgi:hypothetical protein
LTSERFDGVGWPDEGMSIFPDVVEEPFLAVFEFSEGGE